MPVEAYVLAAVDDALAEADEAADAEAVEAEALAAELLLDDEQPTVSASRHVSAERANMLASFFMSFLTYIKKTGRNAL